MVTQRARLRRSTLACLALAPLLATVACGSSSAPGHVSTSAVNNAVVAPTQPVPSHTPLDAGRMQDVENAVNTVTGDKALGTAGPALIAANNQLRAVGALAPPDAKRLNDLRTAKPKNCVEIRAVAGQADQVLNDGHAAVAMTSATMQTVTSSVARLRPVVTQARTDIMALQATAGYATSDARSQLQTYSTALDAAEVNLDGNQTVADEARTRVQKLTATFSHLQSARDKALQGC